MITNLYTYRSYARCISEGYTFLAKNLWTVCKVMVPYFLAFSIIFVISNAVNTHANVAILAGKQIYLEEVIVAIVFMVISIAAYIIAIIRLYKMFRQQCGIAGSRKIRWGKTLKAIFRHIGKVTGTTLLSLFILAVLSAVVYIPYIISLYAYFNSVEGQVNFGDTTAIPTSGLVLAFAICTLCYTIINIISVGFYASLMFLYGSIKNSPTPYPPKGVESPLGEI